MGVYALVAAGEGLGGVVLRLRPQSTSTLGPRLRGGTVFAFSVFSSFVMPDLIRHPEWLAMWLAVQRYRILLWTPGLCPG